MRDELVQALEDSRTGMVLFDGKSPGYPVVYCNSAFMTLTGLSAAQVTRARSTIHARHGDEESLSRMLSGIVEESTSFHVHLDFPEGQNLFCHDMFVIPLRTGEGGVSHYLGVLEFSQVNGEYNGDSDCANASFTGLPDCASLEALADAMLAANPDISKRCLMAWIDIDRFKPLTNTLGVQNANMLLTQIAARLHDVVPSGSLVAHAGSDEYVVFYVEQNGPISLRDACQTLMDVFHQPFRVSGTDNVFLTCSIGVSQITEEHPVAASLVKRADLAMSQAKKLGRNMWSLYTQGMETAQRKDAAIRSELHAALRKNEFRLVYQPQIDLITNQVSGMEALIRWQHPVHGLLSPDHFIEIAEDSGLIVDIGRWVLEEACRVNRSLINMRVSDVPISVNVSFVQFARDDFVDEVFRILEETGMPADRLVLEVTESTMAGDMVDITARTAQLTAAGVRLSIDDFGTGYSSLAHLRALPISRLKIDKSFIERVTESRSDAGIVLAIISMARHLGMKVVAEGVETEGQSRFLIRHHCHEAQGYYISVPLDEESLTDFLLERRQCHPSGKNAPTPKRTVLVVDDETNIIRALARTLRRDGYRILTAEGPAAAFQILANEDVQVVVSDQRMPEMTGLEFLRHVKEIYPDIIRIILSGYTEPTTLTTAINQGAIYRFLTKPWEDDDLRENVREAFRNYEQQNG